MTLSEVLKVAFGMTSIVATGTALFIYGCGNWTVLSWMFRLIMLILGVGWVLGVGIFIWWLDECPSMINNGVRF